MIPLFITNLLDNKDIPLYDDGSQIRDWLHVLDNCEAILQLGQTGFPGEIYNIGACQNPEWTNLDLTKTILELLDKPEKKIKQVVGIRPGHDQRYAVSTRKISKDTTWKPKIPLARGLENTVAWYVANKDWWLPLKSSS
jgi:dTDP-glucose 4,6-dehydratase